MNIYNFVCDHIFRMINCFYMDIYVKLQEFVDMENQSLSLFVFSQVLWNESSLANRVLPVFLE